MIAPSASLPRPLYIAVGTVMGAVVLGLSLSPITEGFVPRMMLFYVATVAAYGMMPYVRRGDIPLVAAWVVLLAELAPCVLGRLIDPMNVTADAAGVVLAAGPIYVARLRQVLQGDTRPVNRRASEH